MIPTRPLPALALATLLVSATAHTKPPSTATFTAGGGCIRARGARTCEPARIGSPLARWQTLVTDRRTRVGLGEGAWVDLDEGSELEIAPETAVQIGPRSVLAKGFRLVHGRAEIETTGAPVLATGPLQTASLVRHGTAVARTDRGSFVVGALEGDVSMSVSGTTLDVPPSTVRAVRRGQGTVAERAAVAAPRFDLARTVAIATNGTAELPLRWSAVPGARGYELRVLGDHAPILATTASTTLTLAGVAPGEHTAQIRAVDEDRLPGAWSAPQTIHVVGVTAPSGSRVRGGTIAIPPRSYVQLSFTDGLEAHFAGSDRMLPAPKSLTTVGGDPQLLELRAPGDREDATIRIEPRSVRAVVEMSPTNPRWPTDTVHVVVHVEDDAGEDAIDETGATPTAMLGLEPLDLDWRREGNELRADVAPRPLLVPDVVRIEIRGKDGTVLGHGHREIDAVRIDPKSLGRDGSRSSRSF